MDATGIGLGDKNSWVCTFFIKKAHYVIAIDDWQLWDEEWRGGCGANGERLLVFEFSISGGNQPLPLGDG